MTPPRIDRKRRRFLSTAAAGIALSGLGSYARGAAAVPARDRRQRLREVRTWMMQLGGLDVRGAVDRLAASAYAMLVLEPGQNLREGRYDTRRMLSGLRTMPSGEPRLLIANIDVGNAETYRSYWRSDWVAPRSNRRGQPDFLIAPDPDGWHDSFTVAFWDARWQALWLGKRGIVAQLASLGFDGVCIEGIDSVEDDAVEAEALRVGRDVEDEMIDFVEALAGDGRRVLPDFLVLARDGAYLIDADPDRYAALLDGLVVDDTWFHGEAEAEWDDPRGGDQHRRHEGEWSTERRLAQYRKYQDRGLPVFSVDYCVSRPNAAAVYRQARAAGLRPLVTRGALSRMTETPPDAFE